MYLKCHTRRKYGKDHRYWSIVASQRVSGGGVVQRHVLYLGEINDSQQAAWRKTIEVLADGEARPQTLALFPADRLAPLDDPTVVQIRLDAVAVRHARQWGGCWLAGELYGQLDLDAFWQQRLP